MGPNWKIRSYYVKMGSNGSIGVQIGHYRSKHVKTRPNLSKKNKIGLTNSNMIGYGLIWSKMVHNCLKNHPNGFGITTNQVSCSSLVHNAVTFIIQHACMSLIYMLQRLEGITPLHSAEPAKLKVVKMCSLL